MLKKLKPLLQRPRYPSTTRTARKTSTRKNSRRWAPLPPSSFSYCNASLYFFRPYLHSIPPPAYCVQVLEECIVAIAPETMKPKLNNDQELKPLLEKMSVALSREVFAEIGIPESAGLEVARIPPRRAALLLLSPS